MHDVLIIGSGVIGMSIARHLSQSQMDVAIVDRDVPGKHASYKAGGMLGAQNEFTEDTDLFRLALESRSLFPELCEALENETGIDIQYQSSGLIKVANRPKDIESLRQQYEFLSSMDPSVVELSDEDLIDLTHGHVTSSEMAIYIPNDGQINANHYTKALFKSLQQRNIHRYYQTEVLSIEHQNGYYEVSTSNGQLHAKKVIVACGAWSSKLLEHYQLPREVVGVKGEVLLVEHDDLDLKETVFMTNGCYIVPKQPNRFLIGATSEFDNYSVGNTDQGVSWLHQYANERIPELAQGKVIKQWSGVRPYTDGELPIMDRIDDGLYVISGHYRNGILLSPVIGRDIANWLFTGVKPRNYESFNVSRRSNNEVYH
ncbi:glycine oxidase ThiO [Staphylococcus petrasii]|uniref:glycine oxidase ThiO n=1 Tax=Staphylococcus petrasii TaxID=1276936 RepID=UPI000CD0BB45|nr:glycine oxidase ThiO [Staphylococcus petrasii]PNZ83889.1 glycine oxidase ThiO [Staphylococcus petrasii]TGA81669.1 glycine oxidase ThiO [Staphylococcus petrasii]SUM59160.1 glycine oxidase thio [Staphylococcus petrasii]